jgi:hypothetical protein
MIGQRKDLFVLGSLLLLAFLLLLGRLFLGQFRLLARKEQPQVALSTNTRKRKEIRNAASCR